VNAASKQCKRSGLPSSTRFLWPQESPPQAESQSVQPCLHSKAAWHSQTDRCPGSSIAKVLMSCIRCSLKINALNDKVRRQHALSLHSSYLPFKLFSKAGHSGLQSTKWPVAMTTSCQWLWLPNVAMCDIPTTRTSLGDWSFTAAGPYLWNNSKHQLHDSELTSMEFHCICIANDCRA